MHFKNKTAIQTIGIKYTFSMVCMKVKVLASQSCPTLGNPMNCSPPGSFVLRIIPSKNTGVGCHSLLQGVFLTQGMNTGLLHCRQILYRLSPQGRLLYPH